MLGWAASILLLPIRAGLSLSYDLYITQNNYPDEANAFRIGLLVSDEDMSLDRKQGTSSESQCHCSGNWAVCVLRRNRR